MALDPPIQRGGWESQDWLSKQQCRGAVVGVVLSDTPLGWERGGHIEAQRKAA